MDSLSGVGVIDKSAAILEALAEHGPATLAELVDATGISRPTAHRLAVALEAHGLVGRDERGRFRLGVRLAAWGRSAVSLSATMLEQSADVLADRCATRPARARSSTCATATTGSASRRPNDHRDCATPCPSGARLPLIAGSGGKVLLAWDDPAQWPGGADASASARSAPAGVGRIGRRAGAGRRERRARRFMGRTGQ